MKPLAPPTRQHGIALVFVLLMMTIAITAALFSARLTLLGDKASRNDRDRQVAFQAAELALNDAELDIMDAALPTTVTEARGCKFGNPSSGLVAEPGCSKSSFSRGFCGLDASKITPVYKQINWEETDDSKRAYVKFGEFTGRSSQLATGADGTPAPSPAKPPKYIIVQTPAAPQIMLGSSKTFKVEAAYKIYALGYGVDGNTKVMLEGEIYKPMLEKKCG
ncbi:MAG: hypothetical protein I8H77_11365 [Comamonadaceae bacterium]|nr:hypothetical protein [Comamonadaceae bacterium]